MKKCINIYTGVISSLSIFLLSVIFLYFNPYNSQQPNQQTIIIVLITLLLPACLAIIASIIKNTILMSISFIWLLPTAMYLGLATIPSLWNLYFVFLFVYLCSIFSTVKK